MQLELVEVQRRVKARVPLPWIQHETAWLEAQVRSARSAVRFGDIPLDWSDFRLALRQTADILYRHDAMDRDDHERILALSRDGNALEPLVKQWYFATSHAEGSNPEDRGAGWIAGQPRPGAAALAPPVSRAVRGGAAAASRILGLAPPSLSDLRVGTGLRRHYAKRRSSPDLRAMPRTVGVRSVCLPVLRQRRSRHGSRRLRRATGVTACTPATCAAST